MAANIITVVLVIALMVLAGYRLFRKAKKGECSCGCNCGGCSACAPSAHKDSK